MGTLLEVIVLVGLLLLMHEAGHLVAARLLGLRVEKVGFSLKPWPHPFVSVMDVADNYRKVVFLSAGLAVTVVLFVACWLTGLLTVKSLYYAFCFQLILEANPFFSDFTTMFNSQRGHEENYQAYYSGKRGRGQAHQYGRIFANAYLFSGRWYLHFAGWLALINLLLSPNLLRGYFLL